MSALTIAVLVFGAVAGGFVSGLAGFGTALIALGVWLNVLPPAIAGTLVIICSVVSQTAALPTLWRTIDFKLVWPFLVGGLMGVPLGTLLIARVDPGAFKLAVGVLLLVFPSRAPLQPAPLGEQRRRPRGRWRRRTGRRRARRARWSVWSAADPLGERQGLGQGRAARRLSDVQLDHPHCLPVHARRHRDW